jgi:hypothetical protein
MLSLAVHIALSFASRERFPRRPPPSPLSSDRVHDPPHPDPGRRRPLRPQHRHLRLPVLLRRVRVQKPDPVVRRRRLRRPPAVLPRRRLLRGELRDGRAELRRRVHRRQRRVLLDVERVVLSGEVRVRQRVGRVPAGQRDEIGNSQQQRGSGCDRVDGRWQGAEYDERGIQRRAGSVAGGGARRGETHVWRESCSLEGVGDGSNSASRHVMLYPLIIVSH